MLPMSHFETHWKLPVLSGRANLNWDPLGSSHWTAEQSCQIIFQVAIMDDLDAMASLPGTFAHVPLLYLSEIPPGYDNN